MFIFALVSIPILLYYLNGKFNFKEIVYFFIGILASQFISILMWSISTLYSLDSDYIFLKLIKFSIVDLFPILILFTLIGISFVNKKNTIRIKDNLVYGFLYWNMIFGLLYRQNISNNIGIFLMPITYMILIYSYFIFTSTEKSNLGENFNKVILIIIPLILLISYLLFNFSTILFVVFIFIQLLLLFLLKRKNKII